MYFTNCRGWGGGGREKTLTLDVISLKGWMWMAKGSFSLLSSPLVAGTAFIVLQKTLWFGVNLVRLLGREGRGGTTGVEGMMLRLSSILTGWRLGSL